MARTALRAISAAFLLSVALTSCDNFNLISDFAQAANSASATSLAISPVSSTVMINGSETFSASGGSGSYLFSVGGSGGTIVSNPGANVGLYNAPSTSGTATVVVTDSANGRSVQATVTIVGSAQLHISPTSATLTAGSSYQFAATGGSGGYTFSVANSDYPLNGESITTSGYYIAPNSTTGSPRYIRVTDSSNATSDATVTIVTGGPLSISPSPSAQVTENSSLTFSASGGSPPYTFTVTSGVGTINSTTGVYTPPANTVGASAATVTVTDSTLVATASTSVDIIPAAPSNLTGSSSSQKIQLNWTNNASPTADNCLVERQTVGLTGWTVVATLAGSVNGWQDTTVQPNNTLYAYRVRALSGSLYSAYSGIVYVIAAP